MTTQEFSNMFDTLLNSYSSQAVFGETFNKGDIVLDEYEKSVLLTQAQDIIVKSYFNRASNSTNEGFDDSSRRQIDFSSLITVKSSMQNPPQIVTESEVESEDELENESEVESENNYDKDSLYEVEDQSSVFDDRGILFKMPSNLLIILNERIIDNKENKKYVVIPINYREYDRQMSKAYNQPLKKQCWRLFQSVGSGFDMLSEVIPIEGVTISEYRIRYIRRPNPIILTDLSLQTQDNLEIDGYQKETQCELNPILHMEILNKAVELALTTRGRSQAQPERQQ